MAGRIAARLAELGITLPTPPAPVATYVPFTVSGKLVFISGQVPLVDGKVAFTGKLGGGVSIEHGQAAARACFINILAQAGVAAGGDLDRVSRVLQLRGYVACTADFADHPKVVNGASDLSVAVFGEAGRHARAAVGVPSLPLDSAVEVEAVIELG
jgi:enamine deaminase RidA (YjgF/YER057c/UK114 family)